MRASARRLIVCGLVHVGQLVFGKNLRFRLVSGVLAAAVALQEAAPDVGSDAWLWRLFSSSWFFSRITGDHAYGDGLGA